MQLLNLIFLLILIGIALYLVERFIPMDEAIKTIIRIVVILVVIFAVIGVFISGGISIPTVHFVK